MPSVLLVEDDPAVSGPLIAILRHDGYDVDLREAGGAAIDAVRAGGYELVVLDLGLPDVDGLHVCRAIREFDQSLPMLILTARADEVDIVVGLDAGADDYLTKPFRLAELQARMRALTRRVAGVAGIEIKGLRIEPVSRQAWIGSRKLDLATKEFDLVALLARHVGAVVARAQIAREVWGDSIEETSRTIDTHVSTVRRKLADADAPVTVLTSRGVGFRLVPL